MERIVRDRGVWKKKDWYVIIIIIILKRPLPLLLWSSLSAMCVCVCVFSHIRAFRIYLYTRRTESCIGMYVISIMMCTPATLGRAVINNRR